jgi:prepilin-type N-terminal cleavage/methylation domain-containing protein
MRTNIKNNVQDGFTIIELLVATSILSVILLLVTGMLISISNLFLKDVNQSKIQDTVRSISDELSNQLQLTADQPQLGSQVIAGVRINTYCIGPNRYSFVLDTQMGTNTGQIPHVLWRDTPKTGCDPSRAAHLTRPGFPSNQPNGADLISTGSQLTDFCIGTFNSGTCLPAASPYTVSIGVGYGASDLLHVAGINSSCNVQIGDQFCATASLVTTVANRL